MSKSGKNTSKDKGQEQNNTTSDFENTGNYLRTLRLGKGLSTKDVTEATRISETNIKAIEDQDYSSLPADTFTRGLLNIYANYLGADAETVIEKFMVERSASSSQKKRTKQQQSTKILTPKRLAEPTHFSSITMAAILLVIIIFLFTGYCIYTSWNPFSFLIKEKSDIQSVMKNVFPPEEQIPLQEPTTISSSEEDNTTTQEQSTPSVQPQDSSQQDEQSPATETLDPGKDDGVVPENPTAPEDDLSIDTESQTVSEEIVDEASEVQTVPEKEIEAENENQTVPEKNIESESGDPIITPEGETEPENENQTVLEKNIESESGDSIITPEGETEPKNEIQTAFEENIVAPELKQKVPEKETSIQMPRYRVFVRFLQDTMVDFTGDSAPTVTHEFNKGNIHTWYADSSLTLTFSQPGSAEIMVNDSVITFPEEIEGNYPLRIPFDLAANKPDE